MQLPGSLSQAIQGQVEGLDTNSLSKAVVDLSARYRSTRSLSENYISTQLHRTAYVVFRMPATYGAIKSVLLELKARLPDFEPYSLLDIGAGPGTAMWAAFDVFEKLDRVTLVEKDRELIKLGQSLTKDAEDKRIKQALWCEGNLQDYREFEPHDLVIASYSLGELRQTTRISVVRSAWQSTKGAIAVIEPGTPRGFSSILEVRNELISSNGHIIAPCPHSSSCPMVGNDWCHFSKRIERTLHHRLAKDATLPYEDEKYSYVIASKFSLNNTTGARIIRHPIKRMGHIHLDLCTTEDLKRETISKKRKTDYQQARKAEWGDWWKQS
jgi:ribosomal protein RSM22 (predicted rRNA methylase)